MTQELLQKMVLAGWIIGTVGAACAQDYPRKSIRIVTVDPGGNGDFTARLIALGLTASMNQTIIIENRPSGVIPPEIVARATPDGYTLLVYNNGFWIKPLLEKTTYDPVRDFAPVTMTHRAPNILVVNPALPIKSVKDLIALARSRPATLNYSSSSGGSASHLAGQMFTDMAGVNIVWVPYKGDGPAIVALLGGEVQLMFASAASVAPHVKSGRLRALAVTGTQPSLLVSDLPTMAAAALPGFELVTFTGVFAPAKTPAVIVDRLNQHIVRYVQQPDVKEKIFNAGGEAVGSTTTQLAEAMKADMERTGRIIKSAGLNSQ